MRARLEVLEGPLAGRWIDVYPGRNVSFGRTVGDIAVPGDGYMSGRHFTVENTGAALIVHDLGSSNGTFVNGKQVDHASAGPQDLIAAGASRFRVLIEAEEPATATPAIDPGRTLQIASPVRNFRPPTVVESRGRWEIFSRPQRTVLDTLYSVSGNMFVYLDIQRDPLIKAFVEAGGDQFAPVLQASPGSGPSALTYLVTLPRESRLHKVLLKEGWEGRWGVYCASPAPLPRVAEHLRSITALETRGGVPFNLPFTDPQFLHTFLGKLAPAEAVTLFGPIQHFFCQGEGGEALLHCTPGAQGVSIEAMKLESKLAGVG